MQLPPPPGIPPPPTGPIGQYAPGFGIPDAPGAVPSMVLGIVAVCLIPVGCCCSIGELAAIPVGILAIVFGVRARNTIRAGNGALAGDGKALSGIIMGGIATGIALILGALVLLFFGLSMAMPFKGFPSPTP